MIKKYRIIYNTKIIINHKQKMYIKLRELTFKKSEP